TQQDLPPMMTTWQDVILQHSFTIHYRPGILNVLPDALSRLFPDYIRKPALNQTTDAPILAYLHAIQDDNSQREIVPESERQNLLHTTHIQGHLGSAAMVKAIHAQNKTWKNLTQDCIDFIKRCHPCQQHNIVRKGYHP